MRDLICKLKPYIRPFEKILAREELQVLAGSQIQSEPAEDDSSSIRVRTSKTARELANRLTYFESVTDRMETVTLQARVEASSCIVRNGISLAQISSRLPFGKDVPLPNKRVLRYGVHGIHEYRGKFFPQLVRALINMSGIPSGSLVDDPMCGSGTTLVEALASGNRAAGGDLNPLSVLMARTKCSLLTVSDRLLQSEYERVLDHLMVARPALGVDTPVYLGTLSPQDQEYLSSWFSPQVLADLDQVMMAIRTVENQTVQDLMKMSLSNVLRRLSWQDEEDLRVRKAIKEDADVDPIRSFLEELGRSTRLVHAYRVEVGSRRLQSFTVVPCDARTDGETIVGGKESVDLVVTSPPYATALPYIDTDRLSLVYLGLASRSTHRTVERLMVGNREVTIGMRNAYWEDYLRNREMFPQDLQKLLEYIERENTPDTVGFRRWNLAPLLAKYFVDMRMVLSQIGEVLKPGAKAYVVVGSNTTTCAGKQLDISTPAFLTEMASDLGFEVSDPLPMSMLASHDIFRNNAGSVEMLLKLQKPK